MPTLELSILVFNIELYKHDSRVLDSELGDWIIAKVLGPLVYVCKRSI